MSNIVKLIVSIVICQLAGITGIFFTGNSMLAWYSGLNKPSFNPPNWVFGSVWIVLYLLMGISLFMVWKEGLKNKEIKSAFIIFIVSLIFNAAWPVIFFGGQSVIGGLIVDIVLWLLMLITILKFIKISRTAGILLLPYLLWVSFATVLNFFIYKLN